MSNDFESFLQNKRTEQNEILDFVDSRLDDYKDDIKAIRDGTYIKPLSTGISGLDPMFKYHYGMLLLITGYPQSGKSELARFIMCNHVINHGDKVCMFSPESDTPILINDCSNTIHHITGMSLSEADKIVQEKFVFQEIRDSRGMPNIEQMNNHFRNLYEDGFKFFIIDPMNWVTSSLYTNANMVEALRLTLTALSQTAKRKDNKCVVAYVEHPKTPQPGKDGQIPKCTIFSTNGGAMHNNKVDGCLIAHRERYPDNQDIKISTDSDPVLLEVAKLKNQKYLGIPGSLKLHFDWKTGIYQSYEDYERQMISINSDPDYGYHNNNIFKNQTPTEF